MGKMVNKNCFQKTYMPDPSVGGATIREPRIVAVPGRLRETSYTRWALQGALTAADASEPTHNRLRP
ncbi:MAG: hypothetical protein ACI91T_001055 [Natronomonas sp.]|jgi:hypothetical protein